MNIVIKINKNSYIMKFAITKVTWKDFSVIAYGAMRYNKSSQTSIQPRTG